MLEAEIGMGLGVFPGSVRKSRSRLDVNESDRDAQAIAWPLYVIQI